MKKAKWIEKKEFIVTEIICNICNKDCFEPSNPNEIDGIHGFMQKEKWDRYETQEFDICRDCLINKIFPMFTIPIEET